MKMMKMMKMMTVTKMKKKMMTYAVHRAAWTA